MKTKRTTSFLILLCVLATVIFFTSSSGRASQAGKERNDLNEELNVTYNKVLALVTEPQERKLLEEAQKAWLLFRDAEIAFHGKYFPGSKGGLFVGTDMTKHRIEILKVLLTEDAKQEHETPFADAPH